jgi:hypothetical protein
MIVKDGIEYARVTDVINHLNDFSGIPPHVLQNKADIGTRVHDAIEVYSTMGFEPLLDSDAKGYFSSFKLWWDRDIPEIVLSERRLFCDRLLITGKMDMLIRPYKDKPPVLIDFKTSVKESPTWILQAHFYHYLIKSNGHEVGNVMHFIKLNKQGKMPDSFSYTWTQENHDKCEKLVRDYWELEELRKNAPGN